MIPDHLIEEVRARADIVAMIGEHVSLKKAGKEFKALCPFHREKTPSFYVVPDKGFYKCFGCGASGDLFTFLIEHVGLDFQEAVRTTAQRVGVEIPDARATREPEQHRALYEAVAFAADFYERRLHDEEAGRRARAYLESRGIPDAAIERYRLGFAPAEWRELRSAAHTHGIEDEVLLEAGLIKSSEKVDEPYDRLRDRIVFPIANASGRVVAFGGRVLGRAGRKTPKYLNSPETPIYHKGSVLYGLNWAKNAIRREETALVVEGYMDYVSLAARGIENVVAPLGTSMTDEQAALLARYTKRAHLLFDSDKAGLRASFRSGDALLRAGVHPIVVTLPEGEDPDTLVRTGGAEALTRHLDEAMDVLDRKIRILEENGYFRDVEGRRKAIDGLLPTLRAAADPALRDIYIARIVERTGIRRKTLEQEVAETSNAEPPSQPAPRRTAAGPGAPTPGRESRGRPQPAPEASERTLLLLLVKDPERVPEAKAALDADAFHDPVHRALFEALVDAGGLEGVDVEGDVGRLIETLRADPTDLADADRVFREQVATLRLRPLQARLDELRRLLAAAAPDEQSRLLREIEEVRKEKAGVVGDVAARLGYRASGRARTWKEQGSR